MRSRGCCLGVALFQGSLRPQVSCPERQRSPRGSVPEDSPAKASRQGHGTEAVSLVLWPLGWP